MTIPTFIENQDVGAEQALVEDPNGPPAGAIDVTADPYNAALDGTTDDSGAIEQAIQDADGSSGQAVYIPAGTALIGNTPSAGDQTGIHVGGSGSGVTLKGAGHDTVLRMEGGQSTNHQLIRIDASNVTDFTVRDLQIDGNADSSSDPQGWGILTPDTSTGGSRNILIENVWGHHFSGSNFQINSPDTTLRYISTWDALNYHGIGLDCEIDDPNNPITVEYVYATGNEIHGVDSSYGHTVVRHLLSEQNRWGGKSTNQVYSAVWEDCVFLNNEEVGWGIPTGSVRDSLTIRNCMSKDNGWTGWRLIGSANFTFENMIAINNNTTGQRLGNYYIGGACSIDATTLESGAAANGAALSIDNYQSGTPSGTIQEFVDDGGSPGGIDNNSNVTINSIVNASVSPMPLPTNPTSDGGGGDTGGDTGTTTNTGTTGGSVITSWEDQDFTEWGGGTTIYAIDSGDSYEGTYSLVYPSGADGFQHLISQSGLPGYPEAGDSFSWRQKLSAAAGEGVVAFGTQSTTWPPASYGVRIDPGAGTLVIEKDFTEIQTTPCTYPTGEWLEFVVDWGLDGTITVTAYDAAGTQLATITATDTAYTSGGLAIEWNDRAADTSTTRWDYFTIEGPAPVTEPTIFTLSNGKLVRTDPNMGRSGATAAEGYAMRGGSLAPLYANVLEDWDDGAADWNGLNTSATVGTSTTDPVSAAFVPVLDPPSDTYGYVSSPAGSFADMQNPTLITAPGNIYEFYMRNGGTGADTSQSQFFFGCQQPDKSVPDDKYCFYIKNGTDTALLDKNEGGTATNLFSGPVTIDGTEWARVQLRWDVDGYLEARVENISTGEGPWTVGSATDASFGGGTTRIGTWNANSPHRTDFDGLRLIDRFTL